MKKVSTFFLMVFGYVIISLAALKPEAHHHRAIDMTNFKKIHPAIDLLLKTPTGIKIQHFSSPEVVQR